MCVRVLIFLAYLNFASPASGGIESNTLLLCYMFWMLVCVCVCVFVSVYVCACCMKTTDYLFVSLLPK